MRPRAIKDLDQLSDENFIIEISNGLELVYENTNQLLKPLDLLIEQNYSRAGRIIEVIAQEEAAKYLILLDAVRCPRTPPGMLSKHLSKFNQHLAKGLYGEVCSWRSVSSFKELTQLIEKKSLKYHLDGPNDVDWIFQNQIIELRESSLYVDYLAYNESGSSEESHTWLSPSRFEMAFIVPSAPVVRLMNDMHLAGFSKKESLKIMAEVWRPVSFDNDTIVNTKNDLNFRTLKKMDEMGCLNEADDEVYGRIVHNWPFPLYDVGMDLIEVSKEKLRKIQENWESNL